MELDSVLKIEVQELSELQEAARQLLSFYPKQRIFTLEGDLGAGKTTFVKAICGELGVSDEPSSPTYSIVNEYLADEPVYHLDLYRLKDLQEAMDAGIEEYLYSACYCFIEWPQIVLPLIEERVALSIQVLEDQRRVIDCRLEG